MEYLEGLDHSSVLYTVEKAHGRIEERSFVIVEDVNWLPGRSNWKNLNTIGMVIARRTVGEKVSEERRHFIASIKPDVELFERGVRGHWAIENSSHHILDVTFREDLSRIRLDYAPENMATVRRLANGLLRNENSTKASIKAKTRRAMRRTEYIETLFKGRPLKQL
jgi:predicted transposase YbfD/YdcC